MQPSEANKIKRELLAAHAAAKNRVCRKMLSPIHHGDMTVPLIFVELKKGAFKITRDERNQAQGYIEDLAKSTALGGNCRIIGFVVGDSIADNLTNVSKVEENGVLLGTLYTTTYSQLVDTAEKRMFGLRQVLADRYDDVPGMDLYNQVKLSL